MNKPPRHSTEYDLRFLEAGLLVLEEYLLSRELYWPVGVNAPAGGPPYPRLTLGNLLLSRARLGAHHLTPDQSGELERLDRRLDEIRTRWRNAWEQKAQREYRDRLALWRDFLEDYRQNPPENDDRYAYEAGRRVLLQLLEAEAGAIPPEEKELLSGLDLLLKGILVPGDFVWDDELQAAFPPGKYWYLYGRLSPAG